MHRNERYFDKNEGKHNFFGQLENNTEEVSKNKLELKSPDKNEAVMRPNTEGSDP